MKIPPFKEINRPNKNGYWIHPKTKEAYGGQYISPLLIPNLQKVEKCFEKAIKDKKFMSELEEKLLTFIGVNTPILRSKELEEIALNSEIAQKWIGDQKPSRIIVVPNKLVNLVP